MDFLSSCVFSAFHYNYFLLRSCRNGKYYDNVNTGYCGCILEMKLPGTDNDSEKCDVNLVLLGKCWL